MPSGVTKIGEYAFRDCTSLKSVKFPEALTDIYPGAFEKCSSLQSIEFPAGVTNIYENAFNKCTSLKETKLPEKLETLGERAFYECALENLDIPKGITTLPNSCFYHNNFKEIVIPENVNLLQQHIFLDCPDVEKFTVLNPKCRFQANIMEQMISSQKEDENGKKYNSILKNCTFYGYKGSTLYSLTKTGTVKYNFVALDEEVETTTTTSTTAVSTTTTTTTSSTVVSSSGSGQTTTTVSAPVKTVWGDANCDGEVDMSDVVLIMQSLANPNKYGVTGTDKNHITSAGLSNASVVNNNGSVTNNDAVKIQLFLLGKAAPKSDK
ncbi:leucine-rich repeat protein [Ruminococcus flavefaciens]|nr:leucine-rich repeat protein [Ruminococcus flavefaciens]